MGFAKGKCLIMPYSYDDVIGSGLVVSCRLIADANYMPIVDHHQGNVPGFLPYQRGSVAGALRQVITFP